MKNRFDNVPWHYDRETEDEYAAVSDYRGNIVVYLDVPDEDDETRNAKGRLFAAAPELLSVVAEFIADVTANTPQLTAQEWPDLYITYQKAVKAVAKAKARQ